MGFDPIVYNEILKVKKMTMDFKKFNDLTNPTNFYSPSNSTDTTKIVVVDKDNSFKVTTVALNNFGRLVIIKLISIKSLYCI